MRRAVISLIILFAPAFTLLTVTGCEDKVETFRQNETKQETEPTMVSPGKEKVGE